MGSILRTKQADTAVVLSHGAGGLGALRSLARRGVRVTVIAYDPLDVTLRSRYPVRKFLLKGESDGEKEEDALRILGELPLDGAAILTNSDRMVAVLARARSQLSKKYHYALPAHDIVDALNDKLQETKLIRSLGFNVPKTIQNLPTSSHELARQLRLPIIFKPHSYLVEGLFPLKNAIVTTEEQLQSFYAKWSAAIPSLLAQEVIPGPDSYSWICSCTFDKSHELLDCGIKQKLRAWPAHFGGSCYAISAWNNTILELTRELGRKLKYVGHAGIEFRWDARDEKYYYIEVNPRLPANVCFDEECQVPTVWNTYQVCLGNNVRKSDKGQRNGLYFVDLNADLYSLLADGVPVWKIVLMHCRMIFKPTRGMYFAWDDPLPALVVGYRLASRLIRKILRTARGNSLIRGQR